ncbi:pentapeptide repeat-containing protein [Mycobacteroides abscessus]
MATDKEKGGTSTLSAWAHSSIAVACVSAVAAVALVVASLSWGWVADRIGGLLTPLGAIVAAALASAGAARTLMAQSDIAERNRREDIEAAMWKRYDEAAKQLGSDQGFAVRSAGVYALAGLANDWIRHHERIGETGRAKHDECDTIVNILCAHLRTRSHRTPGLSEVEKLEEELVNEAIISRLQVEFQGGTHGKRGKWAGLIVPDLRGVDLSEVRMQGVELTDAVLKKADLSDADLTGAVLNGVNLSGADVRGAYLTGAAMHGTVVNAVESDHETRWSDGFVAETDTKGVTRMVYRPLDQSGLGGAGAT